MGILVGGSLGVFVGERVVGLVVGGGKVNGAVGAAVGSVGDVVGKAVGAGEIVGAGVGGTYLHLLFSYGGEQPCVQLKFCLQAHA